MRQKHTFEDRLKYMKLLEAGYSINYITTHFGVSHDLLDILWGKYQEEGPSGLIKKQYARTDGSFREMVLRDIENKCLTLSEAAIKYDVSASRIQIWKRKARESGYNALYETKRRGRAENALLKKVRALVEEREARLREIGRKPSKD